MKNGVGTYTYANGDSIKGVYENDKKIDKNKYIINYMNGNVYEGQLNEDNERHGDGTFIQPDGSSYEGQWHNDMK